MRTLLVTGGAGFIGTNFVRQWVGSHPRDRVVVLDALTYAGNFANLTDLQGLPNFVFVQGNILDEKIVETLMLEYSVNVIIHFAAESHVDRSILGPDAFVQTNVVGTHALLKVAKTCWLDRGTGQPHRFHHVSTDEVYGSLGPEVPAFRETTSYAPNSPYAASKASSDHFVRAYQETYGLETSISNCSNNYGPYQFPEKLIPLCISNILDGKDLPIYGDGLQIRDWLFVEDHNQGIERILEDGRVGETYNIGGNNEWTNLDIVQHICALIDDRFRLDLDLACRFPLAPPATGKASDSLIKHVKDRAGHDRRYAVDTQKINHELDYSPRESFKTGMDKTLDWYLKNEIWWRALMDRDYQDWMETQYSES